MNSKTLSMAALVVIIALIALFASRLRPGLERTLREPGTAPPGNEELQQPIGMSGRESARKDQVAEPSPEPAAAASLEPPEGIPGSEQGAGIRGLVVDAQGTPVSGAEVWVHSALRMSPIPWPWARQARLSTHSDEGGRFVVDAQPEESLEARMPGHSPSRVEPVLPGGPSIVLTLRGTAARITGAVLAGGSPVPGAKLDLRRPRSLVADRERVSRRFSADARGTFALADLSTGRATLIGSAPGFSPRSASVDLRAGETASVILKLDPGAALQGIVVGPGGEPLANVEVFAPKHEPPAVARTDSAGAFAWEGLRPGPLPVVARLPGFLEAEQVLMLSPGENAGCTIVLEPLARLEGRVVDISGAPVPGATVETRELHPDPGAFATRVKTDATGHFQLVVPKGSEHSFILREPNQWLAIDASWLGTFVAPRANIELTLRPEDRASAIVFGRVMDGGAPLAGVRFQVSDGEALGTVGSNTPGSSLSDVGGRFRIGPLPARELQLVVHPADPSLPTFRTDPLVLMPNEVRDLGDVVVPARALLVGQAVFEDGMPATRALLELEADDGRSSILRFDEEGRFERGLLPGAYEAAVYGGGFITVHRRLELVAGEVQPLELVLRRASRCPLKVTLPEGESVGQLMLSRVDGTRECEIELDADDSVLWPALSLGAHLAQLTCEGGRSYKAYFDASLPDGSESPVPLVWRRVE